MMIAMFVRTRCVFFFFFSSRRRHTRFDCDWSSDVCSSDLRPSPSRHVPAAGATGSLVPERYTPASEVVGGDREGHPVAREHADAEATHLPRDRSEHVMTVRQMHTKRGIGQHVLHDTVDFYRFFLGHRLPPSRAG